MIQQLLEKGEVAAQRIEGQLRTLKDALETRTCDRLQHGHPAVEWLVMHSSDTLNR